jgi:2-phosphoglycerate kinase
VKKFLVGIALLMSLTFAGCNPVDNSTIAPSVTESVSQSNKYVVPSQDKIEHIVYITKTGHKYHRAGCRYLKSSCIAIDESVAISQGYTPCSVCNP